ncbi:hypothetical protein EVAR_46724_1 [Eumeta japonica]|uniref:Uncharacterized protein n=1 Tax=Eumeta variegata TaxID=151549 RepID=A0A4C1X9R9_EUMVA|nr:hypothetical protein EVAR_46724_1 [Eumeta japonica]
MRNEVFQHFCRNYTQDNFLSNETDVPTRFYVTVVGEYQAPRSCRSGAGGRSYRPNVTRHATVPMLSRPGHPHVEHHAFARSHVTAVNGSGRAAGGGRRAAGAPAARMTTPAITALAAGDNGPELNFLFHETFAAEEVGGAVQRVARRREIASRPSPVAGSGTYVNARRRRCPTPAPAAYRFVPSDRLRFIDILYMDRSKNCHGSDRVRNIPDAGPARRGACIARQRSNTGCALAPQKQNARPRRLSSPNYSRNLRFHRPRRYNLMRNYHQGRARAAKNESSAAAATRARCCTFFCKESSLRVHFFKENRPIVSVRPRHTTTSQLERRRRRPSVREEARDSPASPAWARPARLRPGGRGSVGARGRRALGIPPAGRRPARRARPLAAMTLPILSDDNISSSPRDAVALVTVSVRVPVESSTQTNLDAVGTDRAIDEPERRPRIESQREILMSDSAETVTSEEPSYVVDGDEREPS